MHREWNKIVRHCIMGNARTVLGINDFLQMFFFDNLLFLAKSYIWVFDIKNFEHKLGRFETKFCSKALNF